MPARGIEGGNHLDRWSQSPREQFAHADDQAVDADRPGSEFLRPGESEQLRRELGAAFGGFKGIGGQPQSALLLRAGADQVKIADDRGQQIIEIMCEPARQLPDRLHFLRLDKRRLGHLALCDLAFQLFIQTLENSGAVADTIFQKLIHSAQGVFRAPDAEQRADGGGKLFGLGRLNEIGIGAAIQPAYPVLDVHEGRRGLQHHNLGPFCLDNLANLDAAHIRQPHVEQHHGRAQFLDLAQRLGPELAESKNGEDTGLYIAADADNDTFEIVYAQQTQRIGVRRICANHMGEVVGPLLDEFGIVVDAEDLVSKLGQRLSDGASEASETSGSMKAAISTGRLRAEHHPHANGPATIHLSVTISAVQPKVATKKLSARRQSWRESFTLFRELRRQWSYGTAWSLGMGGADLRLVPTRLAGSRTLPL